MTEKDQVPLFDLVFTHNWEDPECDHAGLQIKSGDAVVAITSGGCNVLGFLLFDPKVIYSVDINPAQSYLLELKIAAIKRLTHQEFISLVGLTDEYDRLSLFNRVSGELSADALHFWNQHIGTLKAGLLMNGKYERFIRLAGKFITALQGKTRVQGLFAAMTKTEQEAYFDTRWNTRRFRYLFKILFNKWILARRGLVADYFHFDDGSKSFAESFYNRSKKAFRALPIKGNYFLSLYLTARYQNLDDVPAYLKAENFERLKASVGRISIATSDAQGFLDTLAKDSINCFALSNICELMSEEETGRLFHAVLRSSQNKARIVFRNLMIPREAPASLKGVIVKNEKLSSRIYEDDRSFVYGKVAAYEVEK